jgi:hypothetical protein
MNHLSIALLNLPEVRLALRKAWEDSQPGVTGGHEEGGFILRDEDDSLSVVRWHGGSPNSILVPAHPDCTFRSYAITATFHTHPNTGPDHLQEPSETDSRAVRDDLDLKGNCYVGEFVISERIVYLITPDGQVSEMGDARTILWNGE